MTSRRGPFDSSDFIGDEIDALFGAALANRDRMECPPRDVLSSRSRHERPIDDPAYEHLAN
jgi:hypothetical protein